MKFKLQEQAELIKNSIDKANKILLHCHPFPDPDSIGSVLAMKEYLESRGKSVTAIIGDTGYPKNLRSLELEREIKPLKYSDVKLKEFDLFLILDSSSKTQITNESKVEFPDNMTTIVIDHHKTNEGYGDINLIGVDYASTTHILYELFRLWNVEISQSMALNLFIGMFADTGGFKYVNTTPEVLSVAAKLASINPNYHNIVFDIENCKSPIELKMMGLALQNTKEFCNGKVAFSMLSYDIIKENNLSYNDSLEGLIPDILRSVINWDIVASLVEVRREETVVSLRTRREDIYDVSKIAVLVGVNGGGHSGAAGTTVMRNCEETKEELLRVINDIYGLL